MSRLNFSSLDQAFALGSSQITDTQQEIENLKKIIINGTASPSSFKKVEPVKNEMNVTSQMNGPEDERTIMMKAMSLPNFDKYVKNYISVHHPEWATMQQVQGPQSPPGPSGPSGPIKGSVSYFGNKYSSTVCYNVNRTVIFFIGSVIIFMLLSLLLGPKQP